MPSLDEINRSIGRLEGKMDQLTSTVVAQMKTQDDRTTAHDGRIRTVENRQHWYAGVGYALGSVMGILLAWFKTH